MSPPASLAKISLQPRYSWGWSTVRSCFIARYRLWFNIDARRELTLQIKFDVAWHHMIELSINLMNISAVTIFFLARVVLGVHFGIRVHLTLCGRNSLYVYPMGTKCTSNAFFVHAENGENIFISLLHFGGGKLATPLRRFADTGIRVSGGFSLLWHALWSGVRPVYICTKACRTRSWFFPRKQRWGEVRRSSVLERFPDGVQGQDGHSTSAYLGYPLQHR